MEQSILKSTKKLLSIPDDYTVFDLDVLTHINSVFSHLDQLGIGPAGGLVIEDEAAEWSQLIVPEGWLSLIKTYVALKVRMVFDSPATSFTQDAINRVIAEQEWRLSNYRELTVPPVEPPVVDGEIVYVPLPSYIEGAY